MLDAVLRGRTFYLAAHGLRRLCVAGRYTLGFGSPWPSSAKGLRKKGVNWGWALGMQNPLVLSKGKCS